MQVSLHGARALRTRTCHHVPLVHISHNPPETIQVTSDVSIGNIGLLERSVLEAVLRIAWVYSIEYLPTLQHAHCSVQ